MRYLHFQTALIRVPFQPRLGIDAAERERDSLIAPRRLQRDLSENLYYTILRL